MTKSDRSNILKLQKRMLKCLLSRRNAIALYLYEHINNNTQDDGNPDNKDNQSPDFLVPAMAAAVYMDIKGCLDNFLPEAYRSGQYYVLKAAKQAKPAESILNLTIQKSLQKSYDLIKAAILNLCTKAYTQGHLDKAGLKAYIKKLYSNSAGLIATTETMRQKVAGAVQEMGRANIKSVIGQAEYMTAGDNKVCPKCASLEGKIMSVDEIQGLIPQHPGCRCWFTIIGNSGA